MVIECSNDFYLEEVEKGLKALATCYLQMPTSSLSRWQMRFEWLLLLHCRSKDVLSEFSGYYCLRLLLDNDSPLATYFIDLFHQLEWLLDIMPTTPSSGASVDDMRLPEELSKCVNELLCFIKPAVNSCRYLFAISRFSPTICSQWLSIGKEMKRQGNAYRDFSVDDFSGMAKLIPFQNLDQSRFNNIKLGNKLGSGGYADVYEGNFVTLNLSDRSHRITGKPVAVKVFRYGESCGESAGSCSSVGSQFFDQMEKMLKLKGGNARNTGSMTAGEVLLSEELWKLVSAKHPNIVAARGYIGKRPEGESGLVMELMDTSLQDYLEEVGEPLEEVQMIDLMLEIAKGMRFLHERELVHKDLKPRNILLRSHKDHGRWENYPAVEVKLADFGLTQRFIQDVQQSVVDSTPAGSYCYMAPEVLQIDDRKTSCQEKVDVFSYGTTCFNILTCEDPDALEFTSAYSKASSAKFYEAVKTNNWRMWVEGKPEYLIDLIARCWDFDPSGRPTFATICSFLQRAILCILSSPVIDVTTLPDFQANSKHSLLNLYKTITWSSDARYQVIGTSMMNSCLEALARDIHELGHMRSNLSDAAILFLKEFNKITGKGVGVSSSKQSQSISVTQLEAVNSEELFVAIEEENELAGLESVTTAVIRVEVQDRRFRIPFKSMDVEWIVYKALVCFSVLSHFPFLDHEHWIQPLLGHDGLLETPLQKADTLELFPFKNDNAKSDLNVDESLIQFLMCFWEKCPSPDYKSRFSHGLF